MSLVVYPSVDEALKLHELLIDKFGGAKGVRDKGLLESAIGRARSGYYETLSQQAAAIFHSLLGNHCFVDGNKRMAFALTAVFLQMNGYKLKVGASVGEKFIIKVIEEQLDARTISKWIEKHLREL